MLTMQLKKLYDEMQKEKDFYFEYIKPRLDKIENSKDSTHELREIESLVIGTPFQSVLKKIDDLEYEEKQLPKGSVHLNQLFLDTMKINNEKRMKDSSDLIDKGPVLSLTPAALFYASAIHNNSEKTKEIEKSYQYANHAYQLIHKASSLELMNKIRNQFAYSFDRTQLHHTPPKPQKYGSNYANSNDAEKGFRKNALIPPYKGYVYDQRELNAARKELGLRALDEEKKRLRMRQLAMTPLPDSAHKTEEKKAALARPVCKNCGKGHLTEACLNPKKPR